MMTRDQICNALVYLGHQAKYWGPDQSSYEAFAAGWPVENGVVPTEAQMIASAAAYTTPKAETNAAIQRQIIAKERLADRPMRELRRMQEWADVPLADVTAAKNRLKALDDDIRALRAQLQP